MSEAPDESRMTPGMDFWQVAQERAGIADSESDLRIT